MLGIGFNNFELLGAHFNGSAQVFVDGQPAVYTTFVDSGTLQVTVDDNVSATVGIHQFTVQQSTGTSNASPMTVYVPQTAPLVMNALPSYLVANEVAPPSIAVGDVNGDGFADVLVPIRGGNEIAILNGNADGSLSTPQFISLPQANTNAYAVAVGDVNGDGNADLVSVSTDNYQTSTVSVLLGDGHGNFQPASSQQTFTGVFPVLVGLTDIDGDGQPDLVVYVQIGAGESLVWLKNTGNGSFAPAVTLAPDVFPGVALADFNQDGKPDILYGAVNPSNGISVFHILLNTGGGNFTDQVAAGFNGVSGIPTVIDFNSDGIPDVVVAQTLGPTTNTLYSFQGNGDGSFKQVSSVSIPQSSQFVTGDFDHDGFPDLATFGILYLFGDGQGNFTPLQIVGPRGNNIAVGDINGDGLPDIVVTETSYFVAVALGRTDRNFPSPLTLSPEGWGGITLGDVNGDGLPEIFIGGVSDPEDFLNLPGTVYLNQGNSSFAFGANTDPSSFAMEDLTGKGVVDLVGSNGNSLSIWPNNGTLSFSPSPITVPTSVATGGIHVADMNGDGYPDIVTAGEILFGNGAYQFTPLALAIGGNFAVGDFLGNGQLDIVSGPSMLLNVGDGTFQTVPTNIPEGFGMAVGDFNGDGMDDLVLNDGGTVFSIWYSKGDGTFYEGAMLSLGDQAQAGAFEVGDFNGDGRLDLAVAVYPTNEVAMFFNQGGGQFTVSYFVAGPTAYSMRAGDLNKNGKLDLVVGTYPPENPPTTVNVVFHK
jgi:hypothetical protein